MDNLCFYCKAALPGKCMHSDPCPLWEEYKENHSEYQEQLSEGVKENNG